MQLTGEWVVKRIGGVGSDSRASIAIAADGAVSGSGGCNRLMGRAKISSEAVRFAAIATTRMACAPAVMEQERRLLEALAATRSYRVNGAGLALRDASGGHLIELTRRP
jgi:putative lipoprotein